MPETAPGKILPALRLADEARCRQLLEDAGYTACKVKRRQLGYHLAGDPGLVGDPLE